MRFIIDDVEFSTSDIGDLEYRDILAMPKQAGMGVQTWGRVASQIERLALAEDGETVIVLTPEQAKAEPERLEPDLLFDSERHLRAFLIMMWLARRTAGQPSLTFDESTAVKFSAVQFVREDDDEPDPDDEPELDPQPPSDSAPDADGEAATSTPPSPASTTPSSTSTTTSST